LTEYSACSKIASHRLGSAYCGVARLLTKWSFVIDFQFEDLKFAAKCLRMADFPASIVEVQGKPVSSADPALNWFWR
jgi:hypothetical protein